ncbi:uncharacterized protein TNCV_4232941 [Trichonephila clavipes]|nr:uncharacterized protein TNCV_4232941 [Trichonephila clavipes]
MKKGLQEKRKRRYFSVNLDMSYCLFRDEISSLDFELKRSCSIPNGLDESIRFLPNATAEIRKTSSLHDISRFYRYFHLIQTNSGMLITWRHYLEILQEHLRSFETLTILNKAMLSKLSDISLEKSYYFTPEEECPFPSQDTISLHTTKQIAADYTRKSILSDEDSSTVSGNSSIVSRRTQILKYKYVEIFVIPLDKLQKAQQEKLRALNTEEAFNGYGRTTKQQVNVQDSNTPLGRDRQ